MYARKTVITWFRKGLDAFLEIVLCILTVRSFGIFKTRSCMELDAKVWPSCQGYMFYFRWLLCFFERLCELNVNEYSGNLKLRQRFPLVF
ncbi:hypothetical protein RA19_19970 [Leisingera sp. ANG-M1]|nr:hypothetical protein RA19_19970 [Leisingera sp. ANG-M1]